MIRITDVSTEKESYWEVVDSDSGTEEKIFYNKDDLNDRSQVLKDYAHLKKKEGYTEQEWVEEGKEMILSKPKT